jgi:hypothetical protein
MELIRDTGTLTKRIAAFARVGQKWQAEAVVLALSTLAHAAAHGDITLATRLANAMPGAGRKAALVDWFENFAPVKYSKKEQAFSFPEPYGTVKDKFNEAGASQTPFYEFTPDRSTAPLTIEQVVKMVKNRLTTLRKEGHLSNAGIVALTDAVNEFRNPVEGVENPTGGEQVAA